MIALHRLPLPGVNLDVETWAGRDPRWHAPDDLAVAVARDTSDAELVGTLAQTVGRLLDAPDLRAGDGSRLLPWRIALWAPPRWRQGIDPDQQTAVDADLADAAAAGAAGAAVVVHIGMWWTMRRGDARRRGLGGGSGAARRRGRR